MPDGPFPEATSRVKSQSTIPRTKPPIAAIRLGPTERAGRAFRYGTALVWFTRIMSVLWVAQGLRQWALVLAPDRFGSDTVDALSQVGLGSVVFFCVVDLIAAVGLWLAASWGGVVWLVAIAGQWFLILLLPRFLDYDGAVGSIDLVLVAAYLALTFQVAREMEVEP